MNSIRSGSETPTKARRGPLVKITMIGLGLVLFLLLALYLWLTQPLFGRASQPSPSPAVEPARLEAHVRKLAEELHPRHYGHLANLDKAADYIRSEFERAGGRVGEQTFEVDGREYRNVTAAFGPETDESIVVGAHYDLAGETHGADDNASGVAGLIELAHLLGGQSPAMRVELVAYTLEEPPFFRSEQMGSFVHAKSLADRKAKVRLMVCLEMIGFFSDEPGSQQFPVSLGKLLYPDRGNFIALVGSFSNGLAVRRFKAAMTNATAVPVYSLNAPAFVPGVDFSDHRNYWRFGYNALMITDTAFYRNRNYHTTADTAGTLDFARMAEVVKAAYNAVLEISRP